MSTTDIERSTSRALRESLWGTPCFAILRRSVVFVLSLGSNRDLSADIQRLDRISRLAAAFNNEADKSRGPPSAHHSLVGGYMYVHVSRRI